MSLLVIPLLARPFGRVPMPVFGNAQVKPLNWMTCLLNRHYVRPELRQATAAVAQKMQDKYPATIIAYLDGNFPFVDNFLLLPHLSHDDGEKLDLAFLYTDHETGDPIHRDAPSFIGYGVFEEPRPGEPDQPSVCRRQGYWQYSLLRYFVPQWNSEKMTLDEARTRDMVNFFAQEKAIGKVFIEPHLKARMRLHDSKVRYHGCQAVRHDDHVHVQL